MRLSRLLSLAGAPEARSSGPDVEITALTADSRHVVAGALFAALPGSRVHGEGFIPVALASGAAAILDNGAAPLAASLPRIIHPEPRLALALLAAAFHDHPARKMRMIGITGSNGKTTVAAMLEAILTAAGVATGVIGTTGMRHPGGLIPSPLTTPDPVALQGALAVMRQAGCGAVVAEVSSHALIQRRTAGIPWEAAAFTNLTRDHLDYHGDMEAYWQAKCRLFADHPPPGKAVVNLDDPRGGELVDLCAARGVEVTGFSLDPDKNAPVTASGVQLDWKSTRFLLRTPEADLALALGAGGRFNVANALTAAALARSLGLDGETIARGLTAFRPVRGRLEPVAAGQPFTVIVDFAHTPDALERLLATAREVSPAGRRLLVFGCGGERDAGKREMMGRIAAQGAEEIFLTDDNPRGEDPQAIRRAVLAGIRAGAARCGEIPDRHQAIGCALESARAGDVVLIAGKGHETVQITAMGSHPFDDARVAREHLARLGHQGGA